MKLNIEEQVSRGCSYVRRVLAKFQTECAVYTG